MIKLGTIGDIETLIKKNAGMYYKLTEQLDIDDYPNIFNGSDLDFGFDGYSVDDFEKVFDTYQQITFSKNTLQIMLDKNVDLPYFPGLLKTEMFLPENLELLTNIIIRLTYYSILATISSFQKYELHAVAEYLNEHPSPKYNDLMYVVLENLPEQNRTEFKFHTNLGVTPPEIFKVGSSEFRCWLLRTFKKPSDIISSLEAKPSLDEFKLLCGNLKDDVISTILSTTNFTRKAIYVIMKYFMTPETGHHIQYLCQIGLIHYAQICVFFGIPQFDKQFSAAGLSSCSKDVSQLYINTFRNIVSYPYTRETHHTVMERLMILELDICDFEIHPTVIEQFKNTTSFDKIMFNKNLPLESYLIFLTNSVYHDSLPVIKLFEHYVEEIMATLPEVINYLCKDETHAMVLCDTLSFDKKVEFLSYSNSKLITNYL